MAAPLPVAAKPAACGGGAAGFPALTQLSMARYRLCAGQSPHWHGWALAHRHFVRGALEACPRLVALSVDGASGTGLRARQQRLRVSEDMH